MVRAFHGLVVKGIGDAYLITFKSPTDALLCAMAVQDQLANRNPLLAKDERFEVRFAINAGEVRVEKKDVYGEAVNIAARIEGLAKGGEIYFSEAVYLMMNKSEVPYESVGEHKLKGISQPVGVYRIPKLAEVGAYKLEMLADGVGDTPDAEPQSLPFGGLALKKVHTSLTGSAMEQDGSFHWFGALSELHYGAGSAASQFGSQGWWRKPLMPPIYAGHFGWGGLRLLLSPATYVGLWRRAERSVKGFKESAEYRTRLLKRVGLALLIVGAAFLAWRQYVAQQEAEAYKALAEQRQAAVAHAAAREAAAQKALSKEKKKMHFPW
jgi:hypothetical protein